MYNHDPRLIFKARLVFKARLLFKEIRYTCSISHSYAQSPYAQLMQTAAAAAATVYTQASFSTNIYRPRAPRFISLGLWDVYVRTDLAAGHHIRAERQTRDARV